MKNLFALICAYVHATIFHADDVFSAAFLRLVRPELPIYRTCKFTDAQIAEINEDKAIAVDIGAQYGITEYDHHQKDKVPGKDLRPDGTIYCGFGKLWRDYGYLLCPYKKAWEKVDRNLVLSIDNADNGVEPSTLSAAIHAFNPAWNSKEDENVAFWRAEKFAEAILRQYVDNANAEYEAEKLVLESRKENKGKVLVLDQYLPWQDTVINQMPYVLFVVYPSARGGYNVQTVPDAPGSFSGRVGFPEKWLGNPDKALGMTFCHPGNFLAAVDTLENAVNVANIAIEETKKNYSVWFNDGFGDHGVIGFKDTKWSVQQYAKDHYIVDGYETKVIDDDNGKEMVLFSELKI